MFFGNCSIYEGERAKLYRSPSEIREDIIEIKNKIESVNSMLNIRNMLTSMMENYASREPETWIPMLEGVAEDARDSLDRLKELNRALDALTAELEDTIWILGA